MKTQLLSRVSLCPCVTVFLAVAFVVELPLASETAPTGPVVHPPHCHACSAAPRGAAESRDVALVKNGTIEDPRDLDPW